MRLIATCKLGLESLVAAELRRIGIEPEAVADARVTFRGDFSAMARACLWLRTAERVLLEVGAFEAKTFDALFEGVKALPWKQYLARDTFIHVNGKSAKSTLFSVSDCQIITKNSVADAYGLEAEQLKDDDYRHVIASMLRVADFGIQSLQMRDAEPAPSQRNDIFTNIEAIHTVQDTEGNTSSYALNMAEESDGTNSYFKLIGVVKKVLDEGTLLVADEMDAHLHPLLTKHLVSLFNSVEFNPNGAQLIFTSHNTNLLDLDVLRRDQIWFTEKDEQTAATDLFSLYDFSIRKDAKVEKSYLIGRYGAIPFIKGGL